MIEDGMTLAGIIWGWYNWRWYDWRWYDSAAGPSWMSNSVPKAPKCTLTVTIWLWVKKHPVSQQAVNIYKFTVRLTQQ